jgi:hypothetical protein
MSPLTGTKSQHVDQSNMPEFEVASNFFMA